MAGKPGRPGAAKGKKGLKVGTGGHGKQALEGRGPTPKAEDRPYHKAYKAKAAAEKHKAATGAVPARRGEFLAPAARTAIRTSCGPSSGAGIVRISRESGPSSAAQTAARYVPVKCVR